MSINQTVGRMHNCTHLTDSGTNSKNLMKHGAKSEGSQVNQAEELKQSAQNYY